MKLVDIAMVCHEANRAYCMTQGDHSQPPWGIADRWIRDSALAGAKLHLEHDLGPEASHEAWMAFKRQEGWSYGPEKDAKLKRHPCMVPFDQLPEAQQAKDILFRNVVHSLKHLYEGN